MIRELLIPKLLARFPDRRLRINRQTNPFATFPAVSTAVGDVNISDDGRAATVTVGTITHGHFSVHDEHLSSQQIADQVAEDLLGFLDDLFANRVLLWKSPDGSSGGWHVLNAEESLSSMDLKGHSFTWSGPAQNR